VVEQALLDEARQDADGVLDAVVGVDTGTLEEVELLGAAQSSVDSGYAAPEVLRRRVRGRDVLFAATLDREEGPLGIFGILLEEPCQQLQVGRPKVLRVELACTKIARKSVSGTGGAADGRNAPLFKNILTPGGMASTPALIASKQMSSGTGLGVHVIIIRP